MSSREHRNFGVAGSSLETKRFTKLGACFLVLTSHRAAVGAKWSQLRISEDQRERSDIELLDFLF